MTFTRPCGVMPSLSVVNAFMSQNITVMTRRWPSAAARLIDQPFHHARIDISAECLADALLVAQLLDHAIECSRELANFVVRDDFDRSLKVTRFNLAGALQEQPDRARNAAAHQD